MQNGAIAPLLHRFAKCSAEVQQQHTLGAAAPLALGVAVNFDLSTVTRCLVFWERSEAGCNALLFQMRCTRPRVSVAIAKFERHIRDLDTNALETLQSAP